METYISSPSYFPSDGSFHVNQHVNFQDFEGVGLTTGNDYRLPNNFNSESNFDIDATGSASEVTSFHLISVGPAHQLHLTAPCSAPSDRQCKWRGYFADRQL